MVRDMNGKSTRVSTPIGSGCPATGGDRPCHPKESVRCTASALLAFHDGEALAYAARPASAGESWMWILLHVVRRPGADALIGFAFKERKGGLPRYPAPEADRPSPRR